MKQGQGRGRWWGRGQVVGQGREGKQQWCEDARRGSIPAVLGSLAVQCSEPPPGSLPAMTGNWPGGTLGVSGGRQGA